jgi:hypothetical protein
MVPVVSNIEMFENEIKRLWVRFGYATSEPNWFSVSINSTYKHKVVSVNPLSSNGPRFRPSKTQGIGENYTQALTECLVAVEKEFERIKKEIG